MLRHSVYDLCNQIEVNETKNEEWIVGGLMSCLYKQGGRFSVTGCHSGIQ